MRRVALIFVALALLLGRAEAQPRRSEAAPQLLAILGYDGDAMEPFLPRDSASLFFNNRNDPPERTDLHWAERVNDHTFRYRGLVHGANSAALDGVATLSGNGRFCFVSTRSYFETLGPIYCGAWERGALHDAVLQAEASVRTLGRLMFDVEISADGETLVLSDGLFHGGVAPACADLRMARWRDGRFALAPQADPLLAHVNGPGLDYTAGLSADGLTLAFTRLRASLPMFANAEIWVARRASQDAPFDAPQRIRAIAGFAEAPTFAPDGRAIYFHKRERGRFTLWRLALQ
jgi:hypothetical protein